MASERNRILNLINYLESLDIKTNWGKNKAQGNKGFFRVKSNQYRIDISKNLSDSEALRVLVHEFAHYIHFKNDKTLKTLDFLNIKINDDITEELISITVDSIPKETIEPLFKLKNELKNSIKEIQSNKSNFITNIELNSKQKILNRINAKISRINRYYNSPTELFARSMEKFILEPEDFKKSAPLLHKIYSDYINRDIILLNFINNAKIK